MPNWGREMTEQMLGQINAESEEVEEVQEETNEILEEVKEE
jgi:hypothetical protein